MLSYNKQLNRLLQGMSEYRILKIPVSRSKTVFYYYRPYTQSTSLLSLPPTRTLQITHFNRPVDSDFVQKFMSLVGPIATSHTGEFKNKANNKRKRRTIYFALVVFKQEDHLRKVLNDPKTLQSKVNALCKRDMRLAENPLLEGVTAQHSDSESEDEEDQRHKQDMEDGGFTIVAPAKDARQGRQSDGFSTVRAVDPEEAEEYKKQKDQEGGEEEQTMQYTTGKKIKEQFKQDFYKFHVKEVKKNYLEELREGFEKDKKRVAKLAEKRRQQEQRLQ